MSGENYAPLTAAQRSELSGLVTSPEVANQRRIEAQQWNTALGSGQQRAIAIFTVCIDQMSGKYMAFLGSDPSKRETAASRMEAVAALLEAQKLIVVTEIDK